MRLADGGRADGKVPADCGVPADDEPAAGKPPADGGQEETRVALPCPAAKGLLLFWLSYILITALNS